MNRKTYKLSVELIHETPQVERYRVTGGQRSIILQTDRPLHKAKGSKKKGAWKLFEGKDIWDENALLLIIEAIKAYLEGRVPIFWGAK